ncbi:MAG: tandem-95 repeat protein, partial [Spirulinaceae cyanobacterium]
FTTPNVLSNDSDPDSIDNINFSSFDTTNTLGLVTYNGDGTFNYDPNGQFESLAVGETTIDSFSYTIDDGNGNTDTATVNITINGVNDVPVANDDNLTIDEDTPLTTASFLDNDSDTDSSDTLIFTSLDTNNTLGQVSIGAANNITYNPNNAFDYLAPGETATDSFTYTIDDGNGGTDTATVTLNINGVNDAPTISDINKVGDEDTVISFTAADFTDVFNDVEGDSLNQINIVSLPPSGILRLNDIIVGAGDSIAAADLGKLNFTPDANFNGNTSFAWNASDGSLFASGAVVNLTVNSVNDNPISTDDNATTPQDTALTIDVLANDSDPVEGDSVFINSFDANSVAGGSVTLDDNGTASDLTDDKLIYTPTPGFMGTDSFNYTIADGNGGTSTATVNLTVDPANDLTLFGTPGDDTLVGDSGNDSLFGLEGNDTLQGLGGDDFAEGGAGDDNILGDAGDDNLFGNSGNDLITGGEGNDFLDGGADNDQLFGEVGNDQIFGGEGDDFLSGGLGNDFLDGGAGDDILFGNLENDTLLGGAGNDLIRGGEGDDLIDGGTGSDRLFGDGGADKFLLQLGAGGDLIFDFTDGEDTFLLTNGLTFGQLSVTSNGYSTLISDTASSEVLVSVLGVSSSVINEADFEIA